MPAGGLLRVLESGNLREMTSTAAPRQNRHPMQLDEMPTRDARRRSLQLGSLTALALGLSLIACGAGEEADGAPAFGNVSPFAGTGASGNTNTSNGAANTATNTGTNSQTGTNNNSGTTPVPNPSNSNLNPPTNVAEGNPTNPPINSNTNTSMTGAMAPGGGGASGMGNGGAGNAGSGSAGSGTAGTSGMPPVTTPPPPPPPAAPDITCPSGAIFCSGFEGTGFPAGTTFEPSYLASAALGTEMTLDTTVFHSGRQSLKMPVGHNYYRMLTVVTPASYWVRLYTRSNVGFGAQGSTHASLYMGSTLPPGEYNGDKAVELAEQFTQIQLNKNDDRYGTSGRNPGAGSTGTTLPNDTWVCMETQFDGASGDVHVFVEGNEIIDASGWQPSTDYKTFRFGYLRFDSPARDVWVDDVIVSPTQVGCQ
jgi:hypothetical protein